MAENNEDLSVEEILSSIRNILLDENTSPKTDYADNEPVKEPESPSEPEPAPIEEPEEEDIFDLSYDMIIKDEEDPEPIIHEEEHHEVEGINIDNIPTVDEQEIDIDSEPIFSPEDETVPKPAVNSKHDDISEEMLSKFAEVFANRHDSLEASGQVKEWLNENLRPIAEKLVKEEIIKARK